MFGDDRLDGLREPASWVVSSCLRRYGIMNLRGFRRLLAELLCAGQGVGEREGGLRDRGGVGMHNCGFYDRSCLYALSTKWPKWRETWKRNLREGMSNVE